MKITLQYIWHDLFPKWEELLPIFCLVRLGSCSCALIKLDGRSTKWISKRFIYERESWFCGNVSLPGFCCSSIHFIVAVSLSANVMKLSRKWYFSFVLTLIYRGKWKYIALNEVKIVLITDDVRFLFAPRWSVKALVLLLLGCICNWLEPSRQWADVHLLSNPHFRVWVRVSCSRPFFGSPHLG